MPKAAGPNSAPTTCTTLTNHGSHAKRHFLLPFGLKAEAIALRDKLRAETKKPADERRRKQAPPLPASMVAEMRKKSQEGKEMGRLSGSVQGSTEAS